MSRGLQPGTYKLRLAASPSPLVGVKLIGPGAQPVLTRGKENLWRVDLVGDGIYQLFIEAASGRIPLNIQSKDNSIVGNRGPPETTWRITGPEGGPYEIHVDNGIWPSRVWTVETPEANLSPVVLTFLLEEVTPENKKWYFVSPDAQ